MQCSQEPKFLLYFCIKHVDLILGVDDILDDFVRLAEGGRQVPLVERNSGLNNPHSLAKFYDLQVVGVGEEYKFVVVAELYALDLPRATRVVSDAGLPHSQGKGFQAVEDHIVFYTNSQDVVVPDL